MTEESSPPIADEAADGAEDGTVETTSVKVVAVSVAKTVFWFVPVKVVSGPET